MKKISENYDNIEINLKEYIKDSDVYTLGERV